MARYKDPTGKPHRRKHPKRNRLIIALAALVAVFALVLVIYYLIAGVSMPEILGGGTFWEIFLVVYGIGLIIFLFAYKIDPTKVVLDENDLDDTDWLSMKEIKSDKSHKLTVCDFSKLSSVRDGTVIAAEKKGKGDVEVVMTQELHSLIVGTSGTGKTTGFVDQNIAILSSTSSKPSMVITDPKGELYLKHNVALRERGYTVTVLDLRNPYTSIRWNPFRELQRRIVEIQEVNKTLEELPYLSDDAVKDKVRAEAEAQVRKQTLMDEMEESATDIIYTLCPIKDKEQASWEEAARNLILGFLVALCEDAIAGKIPINKIVLLNLYQNITKYCNEDTRMLKSYLLEGRDEFSKVKGLAGTVLISTDRTLTSYLSEVSAYMQTIRDDGILSMTSDAEIDPFALDEKPSAVFIGVPDEKDTRHPFVTLFIAQLYKELTEKCNMNLRSGATKDMELKRRMYFILDEFGNIPAINKFDKIISVARSRGFRFLLILQSFAQLDTVYGKDVGTTVRDNCAVKIFIGTDDGETKKEFSQLCGMRKIKSLSVNTSVSGDPSSSTSAHEEPLITEAQLQRLNGQSQGDAIVCIRGFRPIWGKLTPSYNLKEVYFPHAGENKGITVPRMFDKKGLYEDVANLAGPLPLTEDEKKLQDELDAHINDFMSEWEGVLQEEPEILYPYDENEASYISEEDEEFIRLINEEFGPRKFEEEDVPPTFDEMLMEDFPEMAGGDFPVMSK